ncbi:MAG: 30S ribosomal protein THX [Chitinophagaceae bacterium]|nr:30S ribosomal protein THX [Chitinophagaceae bacterium]MCB9045589.1 30S ribosomal protein THX [Chitinophagales bacterium]
MGRGDKRTKKGKIFMGTFGVSRLARPKKATKPAAKKAEKGA